MSDIGNALGRDLNRRHGVHRTAYRLAAVRYQAARLRHQRHRLAQVVGGMLHRGAELLHARRGLFDAARLAANLLADIEAAGGNGVGAVADLLCGDAHLADNLLQPVADAVDGGN